MKLLMIPFVCMIAAACGNQINTQTLTDRQKFDSIREGMPLTDVMRIYGLNDTIGRSYKAGECGYELDTVTMESVVGTEPITPMLCVMMPDSTWLMFTKGLLMMKPTHNWEEQQKDTMLMRVLHSSPPTKEIKNPA